VKEHGENYYAANVERSAGRLEEDLRVFLRTVKEEAERFTDYLDNGDGLNNSVGLEDIANWVIGKVPGWLDQAMVLNMHRTHLLEAQAALEALQYEEDYRLHQDLKQLPEEHDG